MSIHGVKQTVASGLVLGLSAMGTTMIAPAHAESAPTVYSCTTPLGAKDMTSQSDTDFPEVMYVGDAPVAGTYTGTVTAPADLMGLAYDFYGARTAEGYSDQTIAVSGVAEGTTRTFRVTAPKTPIVKGQPLVTIGVGDFGTITPPSTPGVITITAGKSYVSHMVLRDGNGKVVQESDSTCTAKSGSGGVVDTIRVMARSTTTLTLPSSSIAEGEPADVSATVTVTGGTAEGSVKFAAGESTVTVPLSGGQAEGQLTDLPLGEHQVTAEFLPSNPDLYEGSTSKAASLVVASAADATPTTTSLTITPGTAEVNTPVTLKATVAADAGTPTGKVRFQAGPKSYTADLVDGVATATVSDLPIGSHSVTAGFVPTKAIEFRKSNSDTQTLTITPKPAGPGSPTTTSLPEFSGPVTVGRAVSATAYVVAENGRYPEGMVRFTVAGHVRNVTLSKGRATASLPSTLAVGDHEVTATFIPSTEEFETSTSDSKVLRIIAAAKPAVATTLTLTAPGQTRVGTGVPLRAALSEPSATGKVSFSVGSISREVALTNGVAATTLPGLGAGAHTVIARFTPADPAAFLSSAASAVVTVSKTATATAVSLRRASAKKVTARVRITSPVGRLCNTKATVKLTRAGRLLTTKPVTVACNGIAKAVFVSTKPIPRAVYKVTVKYAGSAALAGSSRAVSKRL